MNKLLQLKAWQLFGLLVGIPFILQIINMAILIFERSILYAILFPIMMLIGLILFFGWFYVLGTNLYTKLPVKNNMNLSKFKLFLFIPIVYLTALCIFAGGSYSFGSNTSSSSSFAILIIPVHLLSMFGIFYCLYFNAKALKTVELQREVTFNDYAGEFFLIWFFPVGIWLIQPRINKIFDDTNQGPG